MLSVGISGRASTQKHNRILLRHRLSEILKILCNEAAERFYDNLMATNGD